VAVSALLLVATLSTAPFVLGLIQNLNASSSHLKRRELRRGSAKPKVSELGRLGEHVAAHSFKKLAVFREEGSARIG
jgi:hypothetical protein